MKTQLKHQLSKLGLFPALDLFRYLPSITHWLRTGCAGLPPPPVKRMVLAAYLKRYDIRHFIETGTHLGDTLAFIAHQRGVNATSIELDEAYYCAAKQRFVRYRNVTRVHL